MSKSNPKFAAAIVVLVAGITITTLAGSIEARTAAISAGGDIAKTIAGVLAGLLVARVLRPAWEEFRYGGWRVAGEGGKWSARWEAALPISVSKLIVDGKDAVELKMKLGSLFSGGGFASFEFSDEAPGGVSAPGLEIDFRNKKVTMIFPAQNQTRPA